MPAPIIYCADCRWWAEKQNGSTEKNGECHARPPTVVLLGSPSIERESEFPTTHSNDWCALAKRK